MVIVRLGRNDIKEALNLVWEVFREFGALHYTPKGIIEFKKFLTYDYFIKLYESGEIKLWGCKINGTLTGIIALRGASHICLLFVKREYQRRGIAKYLFHTVLMECKKQNIKRITVSSSPYATEIYNRMGFKAIGGELLYKGIRFTPMLYLITE